MALKLGSVVGNGGTSSDLLSYLDFACLAAIEHALTMLDSATKANGRGAVDLSVQLMVGPGNKLSTDVGYPPPPSTHPNTGVIENKHSNDVESSSPPPSGGSENRHSTDVDRQTACS